MYQSYDMDLFHNVQMFTCFSCVPTLDILHFLMYEIVLEIIYEIFFAIQGILMHLTY